MNDGQVEGQAKTESLSPTCDRKTEAAAGYVDKREPPAIALVVERYIGAQRGIGQTAQIALPHILKWTIDELESTHKSFEKFVSTTPEKSQIPVTLKFESAREFAEFTDSVRRFDDLQRLNAQLILSKSLFTQLFAEFDAYIGELLKTIYLKNQSLLRGISREISLTELLDHVDLQSVKQAMLEKEIENFRRESYVEQFANLEKKFSISLREFKEWPAFVELSQRRNIITHNGETVSDQYLSVCDREGYIFETRPVVGEKLKMSIEYFAYALRLVTKVGVMLAYTLWSKVFPKERETICEELNSVVYECLRQKRWKLAADISDFALRREMTKDIPDITLRIRVINAAIGLKFSDRSAEAVHKIKSIDWSASYRDFKLAIAVLEERYADAIDLMKSIGKRGELLTQAGYHTWPLFSKFREMPEFYAAYFDIYGEPFAEKLETPDGPIEAQANAKTKDSVVDVLARIVTTSETEKVGLKRKRPSRSKGSARGTDVSD